MTTMHETDDEGEELHRYLVTGNETESDIKDKIQSYFETNPVSREIDVDDYSWEVDWVELDELDPETEEHAEQSNVALYERRVAVEKAQLTVGEGKPVVVLGETNTIIEGFTRFEVVRDHFGESEVPVYRGVENTDADITNSEPVAAD